MSASVGSSLLGVDEVGELDGVLDEENGGVVSDDVIVALLGVELNGETTRITLQVRSTTLTGNGGESQEDRSLLANLAEETSLGVPEAKEEELVIKSCLKTFRVLTRREGVFMIRYRNLKG